MCRILLINPWIYDIAAYDFWIKPIGLLTIGSILREFGYQISLIDCLDRFHPGLREGQGKFSSRTKKYGTGKFYREPVAKPALLKDVPRRYCRYGLPLEVFKKELARQPRPEVVLVTSGMTYWYQGPFTVIKMVKEQFPHVPVVLGGIYATLCYEHAVQHSGADYVIPGKGEYQVLKLIDDLTGNQSDFSHFPQTIDEYPYPAYDLYAHLASVPVMTSYGCPYNCSFCASKLISGRFLQRDPLKVVAEIEHVYRRYRVRNFVFFDDALLVNQQNHLAVILKSIIEKKIKANFHTPNGIHPKEIDEELARLMFLSNFKTLRLSYETSSPERQQEMGLKVTNDDLIRALDNLEKAGYERRKIDVYVIMGLPGQDLEEILKSMIFVVRAGARIRLTSFSPIPGTRDWDKAVNEYGFPPNADPLLTNNSLYPLRSKEMNYETFQKLRYLSKVLNNALDQGINLFDSSPFSQSLWKAFMEVA